MCCLLRFLPEHLKGINVLAVVLCKYVRMIKTLIASTEPSYHLLRNVCFVSGLIQ